MTKIIGVLLTNVGTPEAPTTSAVHCYLRQFLTDKRIVKLPSFIWWPILHGLVLPFRAPRSAKLYKKIWTEAGSPLRLNMQKIAYKLENFLQEQNSHFKFIIKLGMHYGQPSIQSALEKLAQHNIDELIILPLFPQYSTTTTAVSFDCTIPALNKWKVFPNIALISGYANHEDYIEALAENMRVSDYQFDRHLLISFHGILERFIKEGDPYRDQCEKTATLLANKLGITNSQWTLCYQSRFGYAKWLTPSTQQLLVDLPQAKGIKHLDVICPGFAVDCLETLEEIAIRGQQSFYQAGGQSFRYLPAMNESSSHIKLLGKLILHKF